MNSGIVSLKIPPVSSSHYGMDYRRKKKDTVSLHAQTVDWIAALGATPGQVYIDATDYFNVQMDALGILSNYIMVNLFAGDDEAQAMVCNIAVIGDRTLTEVNYTNLTYDATSGMLADGATLLKTGVRPENVGITGGFSVWMTVAPTGAGFKDSVGGQNLTNVEMYRMAFYPDGPNWYAYWGDNNYFIVSETLTAGLYTVRRNSNTNLKGFKDGVEKVLLTTSTTPQNAEGYLAIFGRNRQGLFDNQLLTGNKMGGFSIEDGLIPDGKRADEAAVWTETMAIMGRNGS